MIPDNFDYFDMWEQEQVRQEKLRQREEYEDTEVDRIADERRIDAWQTK